MRDKEYLKQRYQAILASVGLILLLSAAWMSTPFLVFFAYPQEATRTIAFAVPAGAQALLGLMLWTSFRRVSRITLSVLEGGVIVVVSWALVILFSAWPFMSALGLNFSQAVFESVSGWTTTGLSVVDVTTAGPMVLFWRSAIQFAGGAGLAIIMMSAITGPTGIGIPSAEGRSDQLVPQVRRSARLVMVIYSSYAAVGTLAYWLAGMSIFDAVNHAFTVVSTGGFSTRVESIGYWDSAVVEGITVALMILGSLSFVTAWHLWRGGLRLVARNGEVRLMAVIMPISAAAAFVFTCNALFPNLDKALRVSVFETMSALTTTGFSTVGYGNWNGFGTLILTLLMLIGGGTCSTAGGLKQFRVYLLWKLLIWEIRRALLPRTAVVANSIWEGNRRVFVDDARVRQMVVFVFLYLMTYALGVLLLCSQGFSLRDSIFEFASAIGTVGLSVGVTSAGMPGAALWAETLAMFLGRLEFLVIFISLIKMGRDARLMLARSRGR